MALKNGSTKPSFDNEFSIWMFCCPPTFLSRRFFHCASGGHVLNPKPLNRGTLDTIKNSWRGALFLF
jgi:hypothetical protein